jgi:Glycosyltransferase family 87
VTTALPSDRADRRADLLRVAREHRPLLVVGCLWGAGVVLSVLFRAALLRGGVHADFALFYETIERARLGLPLYGPLATAGRVWLAGPNYNPPHFYLLVMPFAFLPFAGAFIAWTLAGLLAGTYAAGRIARALHLQWSRDGLLLSGGLVLANATLASTVLAGQLSLILALPACLAWLAAREGRWTRAGIWIGLAASVKPFLLIVAPYLLLKRQWRALAAMGAAGFSAVLLGIVIFGSAAFRGWLGVLDSPRMDQHVHNASFAGAAARTLGSQGLAAASVIGGVGLLLTVAAAVRSKDVDRSWLLLMAGALLWSPLGWIYYGWLLMPPMIGLALRRRLPALMWAWALLWLWPPYAPPVAAGQPLAEMTVGSIYFWGLLLLWMGALRGPEGVDASNIRAAVRLESGRTMQ